MTELRGTPKVDDTLGAQFLGNLAAAMYVTIPDGVQWSEIAHSMSIPAQFLWHHMRADLHILQEEL
jgi:hypothetical protein